MRRGVTLVEVLTVAAIVGILATTLGVLLAPAMKRKGLETRVRSDLKQLSSAINIYMGDHDGGYPLSSEKGFSPPLKLRVPELDTKTPSPYGGWMGQARYYYPYSRNVQCREKRYDFEIKFNPTSHPIMIADFLIQDKGGMAMRRSRSFNGVKIAPVPNHYALGVLLDGSVRWFPHLDEFRSEAIGFSHLRCRL